MREFLVYRGRLGGGGVAPPSPVTCDEVVRVSHVCGWKERAKNGITSGFSPEGVIFFFRTSGSEGRDPRGPDFLKEFKWENEEFLGKVSGWKIWCQKVIDRWCFLLSYRCKWVSGSTFSRWFGS